MKKQFCVLIIRISLLAVLLGSHWSWASATALYSVSQSVNSASGGLTDFLSYSESDINNPFPISHSYSFDTSIFSCCVSSPGVSEEWITGSYLAYSSAQLGLLRTEARFDATERRIGPSDWQVTDRITATASFNDMLFTVSEKKPDGTPYLPDGTIINANFTIYLQSFQTGCFEGWNNSTASNLLGIQIGGDYGPTGFIWHANCDPTSRSAILIPIQLVVGAGIPFTETLTSTIYTELSATHHSSSSLDADASHTGGLAITFDSPYVEYTTASGSIYPTSPPAEEATIPEPGSVTVLLSALAIGAIARRRRPVISP